MVGKIGFCNYFIQNTRADSGCVIPAKSSCEYCKFFNPKPRLDISTPEWVMEDGSEPTTEEIKPVRELNKEIEKEPQKKPNPRLKSRLEERFESLEILDTACEKP